MIFDLMAPERGINTGVPRQVAHVLGLIQAARDPLDVHRWACDAPHKINPADRVCQHILTRRWRSRHPLAGFDDRGWRQCQKQFVPVGGQRTLRLRGESLRPVQLFNEHPDIASVHALEDGYVITGLAEGRAHLHPINRRGHCHNLLEVVVRAEQTVEVVLHQVRYPDGALGLSLNEAQRHALVAGAEAIFRPQTGLRFTLSTEMPEFVLRVEPDPAGVNPKKDFEPFRQHARRYPGVLNVFLVRKLLRTGDHLVGGQVQANCIFLSTEAGQGAEAARRLAHEIGHFLMLEPPKSLYDNDGHSIGPDSLMHAFFRGRFLSQLEADIMVQRIKNGLP